MTADFSDRQLGGRGWEVWVGASRGSLDKAAWGKDVPSLEMGRRHSSFSASWSS